MKLSEKVKIALEETRILILGAQILLGFGFRGAFSERFDELPGYARYADGVALALLVCAVGLLIARLFPVPVAALMVGLFVWLCPIRVSPRGIKYPAWPLVVREVPWEEMHTVHYVNLLGFRFLAVYREGAAVGLWLPLFLKNPDLFCEVVCACLGNDHPLSAGLMRHCA